MRSPAHQPAQGDLGGLTACRSGDSVQARCPAVSAAAASSQWTHTARVSSSDALESTPRARAISSIGVDRDPGDDPETGEHRVDVDALLRSERPDRPQRVPFQPVRVRAAAHGLDGERHRPGDVRPHPLGVERPERRHLGAHLSDRLVDDLVDGEVLEQVDHDPLQTRVQGDSLVRGDNLRGPSLSHRQC